MITEAKQKIRKQAFGRTAEGTPVELYTLTNARGAEVKIMTYGASVVTIRVPDREGKLDDVVLGYDGLDGYLKNNPYFGGTIGRYGNRIAKGRFTLDGHEYSLTRNDGENHLHGGALGFDKVVWKAKATKGKEGVALKLTRLSRDGEEGYPGNLSVTVVYTLTDQNELKMEYWATTDKPTIVNLTHHSYFNLAGARGSDILGHELTINADFYLPVDRTLIPTGELRSVQGTPMDFRQPMAIGARIEQKDEQLIFGRGYDHNWVLNKSDATLALAARVYEPRSGRVMEVYTTEPGLQFYSGNFLDGSITGKAGRVYHHRSGFCLEAQHYPDSPNQPNFPSVVLRPGQMYRQTTIYKFSTMGH